jgi:hypothetical protein
MTSLTHFASATRRSHIRNDLGILAAVLFFLAVVGVEAAIVAWAAPSLDPFAPFFTS